ncbi:MAG TPA: gamma-glutamyl-gamma-aminobutyrate hydrolase family protein [Chthonomonadales bacterium]|nr:gamma-glutamyl-gamma-aminobutyrate hydrolase family protein [Chthonomonadales bacterium]
MARKLVGITCGGNGPLRETYIAAVEKAGAAAMPLPPAPEDSLRKQLGELDGLLLSGGPDLAPRWFGEAPHPGLGEVEEDRDSSEMALIRMALEQDMPIFGICRGIQILNVALGGDLFQHIPDQCPSGIEHQQKNRNAAREITSHEICIAAGSRMEQIAGSRTMETNSFHHQALRRIAAGLRVTARAQDGVVEAVEDPTRTFLLAVQFHPEDTAPSQDQSARLFAEFVRACS